MSAQFRISISNRVTTSDERTRTPWARLILGNLLVFSFLIGVLLAGAEVYYGYVNDSSDSINFTKIAQRWFRKHYVVNNAGWRDSIEYSLQIPAGKRRVSFVGDSFTAGHGIKNVDDAEISRVDEPSHNSTSPMRNSQR